MTLEWQLEVKKKWNKMGEQGAKRKSRALIGEELCFLTVEFFWDVK